MGPGPLQARAPGAYTLARGELDNAVSRAAAGTEVTRILYAREQDDPHGPEQLLPLVYDELRRLVAAELAQEAPGQTPQATALVHKKCLPLAAQLPAA